MKLPKADIIIKYATSAAIIYSFVQIVYTINHRVIPEANEQLFTHLVGIIEGAFVGSLCAYYWTKSTLTKDDDENRQV